MVFLYLIASLRNGSDIGKRKAAGALWDLSMNEEDVIAITQEGDSISRLIAQLRKKRREKGGCRSAASSDRDSKECY